MGKEITANIPDIHHQIVFKYCWSNANTENALVILGPIGAEQSSAFSLDSLTFSGPAMTHGIFQVQTLNWSANNVTLLVTIVEDSGKNYNPQYIPPRGGIG
jgi:hypothetical protein